MLHGECAMAQEPGFQQQRSCFPHDVSQARLNGPGLGKQFQRALRMGLKFGAMSQGKVRQVPFELMLRLHGLGFVEQGFGFEVLPNRATGVAVVRQCPGDGGGIGAFPPDGLARIM